MDHIPLFDYVATGIPLLAHRETAASRLGRRPLFDATQKEGPSRHNATQAAVLLRTIYLLPKLRPRSARVADLWSLGKK